MLSYNTEKYITYAVNSFLSQVTTFPTELIISDDRSIDNTFQIAQTYQQKWPDRIKVFRQEKNVGMARNYISIMKQSDAEYIAFLDSDDIWCDPNKLQKQIDFLDTHPEYGVVYTDCQVIDENGNEIFWQDMHNYRQLFRSGDLFFHLLKYGGIIPMLTTCFRRSLITEELEKGNLWYFEDWWLWMRLAIKAKIYYLNEPTSAYRRHANNVTGSRTDNTDVRREYLRKCMYIYFSNIDYFSRYNKERLNQSDAGVLFSRILMLLNRLPGWGIEKRRLLFLLVKYFPGFRITSQLVLKKLRHHPAENTVY